MGGLRKYMPVTFATMMIGTLAIAGIPPLSGFFSKDEILLQTFIGHRILLGDCRGDGAADRVLHDAVDGADVLRLVPGHAVGGGGLTGGRGDAAGARRRSSRAMPTLTAPRRYPSTT